MLNFKNKQTYHLYEVINKFNLFKVQCTAEVVLVVQ